MRNEKVNYFAIILVVILCQVVGFLWYSPFFFGAQWMALVGKSAEDLKAGGGLPFVYAIMGSFLMIFILAKVIYATHSNSVGQGVAMGFILWLGFIFPTVCINNIFAGHSFELAFINSGHFLIDMLLAGGILAVFR